MNNKEYAVYLKEYKQLKKKFKKACKDFQPFDYGFNFKVFLESLRLTQLLWSHPNLLYQDTRCLKDKNAQDLNNYKESFKALNKAVKLGDKIVDWDFKTFEDEDRAYNEFWNIMKKHFRAWWD